MNIRVPETKTRDSTQQRFTTVKKPGKVLYVFVFNHEDFERDLNLHSPFGDRCQRPIKSWEAANRASMPCLTNLNLQVVLVQTGCLALHIFLKYIPWFTLAKHIQTRKQAKHTQYTQNMLLKLY